MRLIIIEAAQLRYSIYEGRRRIVTCQASELLNAEEIEDVRTDSFIPTVSDTDTHNDKH